MWVGATAVVEMEVAAAASLVASVVASVEVAEAVVDLVARVAVEDWVAVSAGAKGAAATRGVAVTVVEVTVEVTVVVMALTKLQAAVQQESATWEFSKSAYIRVRRPSRVPAARRRLPSARTSVCCAGCST